MSDRNLRMAALRDSFPSLRLRFAPGKFDAQEVADFCKSAAVTSGSGNAAKFLLSVWSGPAPLRWIDGGDLGGEGGRVEVDDWRWPWGLLPFDLHAALGCWDDGHRRAFQAWVQDPWWP